MFDAQAIVSWTVAAESGHQVLDQDTNAGILTAMEHNIRYTGTVQTLLI